MKKIFLVLLPFVLISCNLSSKKSDIVIENWCDHTIEVTIDQKKPNNIFSESYLKIEGFSCGDHNISIKKAYTEMESSKMSFNVPDDVIKMHFYIYGNPENGYIIRAMH